MSQKESLHIFFKTDMFIKNYMIVKIRTSSRLSLGIISQVLENNPRIRIIWIDIEILSILMRISSIMFNLDGFNLNFSTNKSSI